MLIKGGRVVTAADDYVGDVFVDGEQISLIGASLDVDAERAIDASGKYVLPGTVDPHTHLDMPFGGTVTIDDVESGQTSATFGGTTCHVDFIIQAPGQTFAAAVDEWKTKADGKQGEATNRAIQLTPPRPHEHQQWPVEMTLRTVGAHRVPEHVERGRLGVT